MNDYNSILKEEKKYEDPAPIIKNKKIFKYVVTDIIIILIMIIICIFLILKISYTIKKY